MLNRRLLLIDHARGFVALAMQKRGWIPKEARKPYGNILRQLGLARVALRNGDSSTAEVLLKDAHSQLEGMRA